MTRRLNQTSPHRAPLRYFGGKWRLAPWIISHMPPHQCYVEPCCGGASVAIRKRPAPIEVIADVAGDVVTWWTCLRDRRDELIDAIALTPYAHAEFELAHTQSDDPIEQARRFFIRSGQGVGGVRSNADSTRRTGWRRSLPASSYRPRTGAEWNSDSLHDALMATAHRLRSVAIECRDWREVVERYDSPDTLVYIDPPYVLSERSYGKEYDVEWSDTDHREGLRLLRSLKSMVIVSGYRCALYDEEMGGWERRDVEVLVNGMCATRRMESIWLSPSCTERRRQGMLDLEVIA